jgi:phage terminase large subunit GpA-like protein
MILEDIRFLIDRFFGLTDSLRVELPSVFAERVRFLTADLTPFPGRFSYEKFPYFKKIVDCFSPADPTKEVVLMKGNQMGATTAVLETLILYDIMSDPKAQMFVTADAGLMKTSVQVKIEKMIDNAGARDLIFSQNRKKAGSKDTGDTAIAKEYPGGFLHCYGSRSPARFRGMPYQSAKADEVDAFPDSIKNEGTVIDLVRNRTDAYSKKRKIFWCSTPLVEQTSKINKLYLDADQEKYFVPCKHCGTMQELVWHGTNEAGEAFGIVWENDEQFNPIMDSVSYKCSYCGGLMKNYDKAVIIPKGEWRPTSKSKNPLVKSFHLSPLYNPPGMLSWEEYVEKWAECWDIEHNRIRDKEKYRTFRNTKQGLPFRETGVQIRYERAVSFRRSGFAKGKVPNLMAIKDSGTPILIIVASVDVQKNCLFVDIKGYSGRGCVWTIDFFPIDGDTASLNGPWDQLEEYIETTRFIGDDGKAYKIAITLVDSGWNTEYVYAFAMRYPTGIYACKGVDFIRAGETYKLFDRGTLDRIGLPLAYHIHTTKMKDRISNAMSILPWNENEFQPPWYCNFPEDFRDDYFRMFEAEDRVDEYDQYNRYKRTIWKPKHGAANHGFDTYGYNMAALEVFADAYCREVLGLPGIIWNEFWEAIKNGEFIENGMKS